MSYALNVAISLPEGPLVLAIPAAAIALIILALVVVVVRKRKAKKTAQTAWTMASHELGIDMVPDGSAIGAVATGKVNQHVVSVAAVNRKGRKHSVATQFGIKFEAPEAPQFSLVKRTRDGAPIIDSGNPKFDAVVAIQTEQPVQLSRFLTGPRRAAILRLLTYWPNAVITNRTAHLKTPGIEVDHDKLVDSICHLVAAAETFDRPTTHGQSEAAVDTDVSESDVARHEPAHDQAAEATPAPESAPEHDQVLVGATPVVDEGAVPVVERVENGHADVLTELRLDEITVLNDLFNTGLADSDITARFQQVYQGRDVTWAGEVLRVGSFDETGKQRIAALIGSANGQDANSGRVVALTTIAAQPTVGEGDVVSFSGSLVNLDVTQRLFHVA